MTLRTKFILFIAVIHLLLIALSLYIFRSNKVFFIISEIFIIISILLSRSLYLELIAPLRLLLTGIDAIQDKDFNVKFLNTGKLEMDRLIGVYNKMIDQLREERTRQEQQHYFLDKLIQTSPSGIMILDFDEKIFNLNPRIIEILGLREKELIGRAIGSFDHPVLQALDKMQSGESKTISPNGTQIYKCQKSHFIDRGFAHHFIMIEELTTEILTAEKNAYGKIIRMMAHEVNNSIGAVNSILHTLLKFHSTEPEIQHSLEVASSRNDHLNQFMKKFADLVRLAPAQKENLELNELVLNVTKLMEFKAREARISFQYELSNTPVIIRADAHQMEQVLINVIKNAIESIVQRNDPGPGYIKFYTRHSPKQVMIEDNGIGISPDAQSQLFSSFYTTKRDGQGIGLTIIRDILMNHGFLYSLMTDSSGITSFVINFQENNQSKPV